MQPTRRRMIAGASAAAALSACSRPAARKDAIKIANASGALNLTLAALMKQQKFLESFDLKPDILPVSDGSKILSGIVGGSVDASMISGFGQVFPAVERGAKLKILAGGWLKPTTAMFTAKPDIHTLKDLEGRTVGVGAVGALLHQLSVALLRKKGVDVAKVKFVNIGSSADAFRAVGAGVVDAGPAAAALIPDAAKYHARFIPGSNMTVELADYTYQGAWTSDHAIANQRDKIVRSLAAYAKLYRFAQSDGAKDAFIAARRSVFPNASQEDHDAEWNYIHTFKPFAVDLVLSAERLRVVQDLNVEFAIQSKALAFDQVADMSLARDALKLLA